MSMSMSMPLSMSFRQQVGNCACMQGKHKHKHNNINNSNNINNNNNYNITTSTITTITTTSNSSNRRNNNIISSRNGNKNCSCFHHKRRRCNRFPIYRWHSGNSWLLLIAVAISLFATTPPAFARIVKRSPIDNIDDANPSIEITIASTEHLADTTTSTTQSVTHPVENITNNDSSGAIAMALQTNETNITVENNHDENNEIVAVVDDGIVKELKTSPEFVDSTFQLEETLLTENLEESIRNAVKNQIEIEHNIGASTVERLQDIPEAEVRQKLTEEILAIKNPPKEQVTEASHVTTTSTKTVLKNGAEKEMDAKTTEITPKEKGTYLMAGEVFDRYLPTILAYKTEFNERQNENSATTTVATISKVVAGKVSENPRESRNLMTESTLTDVNMQNLEDEIVAQSAEVYNNNSQSSSSSSASSDNSSSAESTTEQEEEQEQHLPIEDLNAANENSENSIEMVKLDDPTIREKALAAILPIETNAVPEINSEDVPNVDEENFSIVLKENLTPTETLVLSDTTTDQMEDLLHLEETLNESHAADTTIGPELEKNVHIVIKKPGVELYSNELIGEKNFEDIEAEETTAKSFRSSEENVTVVGLQSMVEENTQSSNVEDVITGVDANTDIKIHIVEDTTLQPQESNDVENVESKNSFEVSERQSEKPTEPQIENETTHQTVGQKDDDTTFEPLVGNADVPESQGHTEEKITEEHTESTTEGVPTTTAKEFEAYEDEDDSVVVNHDIVPELMSGGDNSDTTASTKGSRSINTQTHQTTSQMDDGAAATLFESFPPHAAGQTYTDNLAAENNGELEKILPTRSLNEGRSFLSESSVIVAFSGVALLCLCISVIAFLILFQRTHGTLDIEMQEQRCGKDDLDDDDEDDADTCTKLLEIELPPSSITAMTAEETDECL